MPNFISFDSWWLGLVSYGTCHVAHIIIWHWKLFQPGLKLLALIFFVIPGLVYAGLLAGGWDFWSSFAALVTHLILSANYFATYPALQASSPTLVILDALYRSPNGFSEQELLKLFAQPNVVSDRLADLLKSGLVIQKEAGFQLTTMGCGLAGFFATYRKVLGYPPGAG